ncbi:hypothetical protein [Azospirillum sp. A39]|uniref:hypothetical protein n=1 Tax=Azospirillum sp. A39 TaxID=3462279 RepID=UPI0040454989
MRSDALRGPRQRRQRFATPEALWREIRRLRSFTLAELAAAAAAPRYIAKRFVGRLVEVGVLAGEDQPGAHGQFPTRLYRLVRDLGRRCPRFRANRIDPSPSVSERIWAAIKPLRGGFSIRELTILARSKHDVTRNYLVALTRAGYLSVVDPGGPNKGTRYRLASGKHTGPEPPRVLRDGAVYDPNLDRVVWTPDTAADQGCAA